jgi:hypothetical protein
MVNIKVSHISYQSRSKLHRKVEIINGKTVLPVRLLAEKHGFLVDWDANTRQATVLMKTE